MQGNGEMEFLYRLISFANELVAAIRFFPLDVSPCILKNEMGPFSEFSKFNNWGK